MAGGNNRIDFQVGFNIDKTGLNQLSSALKDVQKEVKKIDSNNPLKEQFEKAGIAAKQLEEILDQSWNNKLGKLNLSAFDKSVKSTYGSVKEMRAALEGAGPSGVRAFNQIASSVLNTNYQLKESNKALDKMFQSVKNVFTYNISSSIFNRLTGTIEQAYNYSRKLDSSLNDIRIVTDKSADDMERFAKQANEASKSLGASTLDYTKASLIYYQQGLSDEEVAARAETTIKAANVTGQSGEEVSEQLTAVWNGYKVTAEETEAYVDKLAAVAASTAADLEELSVGMSKVASAANAMGVDFDDLNAQIATIVSVTRQAPESVGTALKTIYARLGDLKVDGVDEFGVSLGEVSTQLQQMGIQVLDQQGNLRNMTDVIAEVAGKWDGWTEAQRQAAAVAMAGKRQYNNLIALFDNWDDYTNALITSQNALGTLQKQEDTYLESTEAHLKKLRAESEKTYDILFDTDTVNGFIDVLDKLLGQFNDLISGLGGGVTVLTRFGAAFVNIFSKQLGSSVNQTANNIGSMLEQMKNRKVQEEWIKETAQNQVKESYAEQGIGSKYNVNAQAVQTEARMRADILKVSKQLTQEEVVQLANNQKKVGEIERQIEEYESYVDIFEKYNNELEDFGGNQYLLLDNQSKYIKELEKEYDGLIEKILTIQNNSILDDDSVIDNIIDVEEKIKELMDEDSGVSSDKRTQLESLLNKLKVETDLEKEAKLIEEAKYTIYSAQKELLDQQKEKYEEIKGAVEKEEAVEEGKTEELKEQSEELQRQSKTITDNAERAAKISNIIQKASGGIEIASSLIGAIKTGLDETATGADKANAIFAGFSGALAGATDMLFPGSGILIQGLASLGKGILEVTGLWDNFENLLKSTDEKIQEMNEHIQKLASNSQTYRTAEKQLKDIAEEYEKLSEKAGEYDSTIDNLTSIERERYNELKDIIISYNQDALIGYNDRGEAILEENGGIQETIDLLKEKYELESQSYYNGEEFEKDTNTLNQKYEEAKKERDNTLAEIEHASSNQTPGGKEMVLSNVQEQLTSSVYLRGEIEETETVQSIEEILKKDLKEVINNQEELNLLSEYFDKLVEENPENEAIIQWKNNIKSITENLEDAKKIAEEKFKKDSKISVSPVLNAVKNMTQYKDNYSELSDAAEKAGIEDIDTYIINYIKGLDLGAYNGDYNEVYKAVDEFNKQIIQAFTNNPELVRELSKEAKIFGEQSFNSYKEYYDALTAKINELANDPNFQTLDPETQKNLLQTIFGLSGITIEDGSFIPEDKLKTGMERIKDSINEFWGENQSQDTINSLFNPEDESDINFIIENLEKLKDKTNSWEEAVKLVNSQLEISKELSHITSNVSIAGDAISTLMAGKDLSAEQIAGLKSLEQEHEELAAIQDKQSTAYLNKLLEIREALEDEKIKLKQLQENNLIDTISLEVTDDNTIENIQNELIDICNADYQVLVEVKADIQDDFDAVVTNMENISSMASKIGDDFIVAAEDLEELNDVFPGILQGLTDLGDGTVQLNEDMVKGATEAAKTEVEKNTEATIQKLKNQKTEIEAKRDAAQTIADIAGQLASDETDLENDKADSVGKINEALTTLRSDNSEEISEQEQDDYGNVEDAAVTMAQSADSAISTSAGSQVDNFEKLGTYGVAVYRAIQTAAETGDAELPAKPSMGTVSISGGQVETKKSNKADLSSYEGDYSGITKEGWKKVQEHYLAEVNAYDSILNNIEGKIQETSARKSKIDKELGNIANGTGADGKKDKSGGGGGKDKQEKELKNLEDEFDRYWELNKAIEATDKAIQQLEKDQANLHGQELINSLKNENELLETQKSNYEALLAAQNERAAALRAELGTMGVIFDASGAIVNYAEATAKALAAYNKAIQDYNAEFIDETTLGVAEKSFENFKKLLEEYDKLYYTEIQETQEKIDEAIRKQKENNLKAWEEKIKIKIDWQDLKKGWRNFLKEMNEDFQSVFKDIRVDQKNVKKNAKDYLGKNGYISIDTQAMKEVEAEIDKMMGGGSSDMFESVSQAQEKLKELNEQWQQHVTELHDLYKEAWQNYLDGIDQVEDKLDAVRKRYEDITEQIEFEAKLIKLMYGDKAYQLMDKYYSASIKNIENQLQTERINIALWRNKFEESGADISRPDTWTEDQKKYYENWQEAQKKVNDLALEGLEIIQDQYTNAIKEALEEMNKEIEAMEDNWEKVSKEMDRYLDRTERAYQIQSLQNKMNKEINNTTDIKNQQKLQALRDKEIANLRSKTKLREIDVKQAELEYELALKQIALEEAQNNKTSMKLTRNAEGNWAYQYVADEDNVAEKQQDVLDTMNEMYQLRDTDRTNLIEEYNKEYQEYVNKLEEYGELMKTNREEAIQKINELETWWAQERIYYFEQLNDTEQNLAKITAGILLETYRQDEEAYEDMTDHEKEMVDILSQENISDYQAVKDAVDEDMKGIQSITNEVMAESRADWDSTTSNNIKDMEKIQTQSETAYAKIRDANKKYQDAVVELQTKAGICFGEEGIKGRLEDAKDATDNVKDATENLAEEGSKYIEDLKKTVEELKDAWDEVKNAIKETIGELEEYLQKQGEANAAAGQTGGVGAGGGTETASAGGNNSGDSTGNGPSSNPSATTKNTDTGKNYYIEGYDEKGNKVRIDDLTLSEAQSYAASYRRGSSVKVKHYDTGGYTGSWGEDGRLAILHQKELVLNKEDTENFLSGIGMIRDMASLNGSIEKSILRSIANMAVQVSGINPSSINTNNSTESNNNTFNITAEFPNANSVDDIRQAILTLPNIASQFINSNRR